MGDKKAIDPKSKFDQVRIITNPLSSNKNLDADGMIENILSKKQIFVKKSPSTFPLWLTPDSGKVPALYSEVWKAVQIPVNPGYCNTPILSQILMSSGVTTQTLGYIWSLANKKCIGVLTEEELYLTMALIAISQNGPVVHSLDILKQVHEPIIPRLDLNIIKHFQSLQRYQQPHGTHAYSGAHGYKLPNTSVNNSPHLAQSNFSIGSIANSCAPTYLGHSSEYLGADNTGPTSHNYNTGHSVSSSYQSETANTKDNIAIQNISSMVQLQSSIHNKSGLSFGQSNQDDDDEFSEFQSSMSVKPAAPAPNVSITLNPIHYLMASPTPNSSNKKPNSGSAQIFSNSNESPTIAFISHKEDDDFTDFQSALDFDVQIKQPNILENIKTIIDTKQNQSTTQKLVQKTPNEHIASVLVDNVPQKTKEELLDTMSDERKTTMYTTNDPRDYSALKELQTDQNSLFEFRDSEPFAQSSLSIGNTDTLLTSSSEISRNEKSSNRLLFENDNIQLLTIDGHRSSTTGNITSSSNTIVQPTLLQESETRDKFSTTILSSSPDDDFDDEFTDFKKADPINTNTKEIANHIEPVKLVPYTKRSSNYDYLRGLDDDNSLDAKIFPSLLSTEKNQPNACLNQSDFVVDSSSNVNDILFSDINTSVPESQGLVANSNNDKVNKNEDDDFDEFVQVPHIPSTFNNFSDTQTKINENKLERQDDDEFTEFANALSSVTITSQPSATNIDKPDILVNDVNATTEGLNDETKTRDEKQRDRYSALRGLDFLDEENDYKYLSDGDTLSLQEDKDRDVSDGDNVSLQLPCVESQEQDNIQTKCYEACFYILDTSLNLFLSNQIENSIVEHPKVIHHLKCLAEVYQVGKRIQRYGQINNNNNKLDITWNALTAYFTDSILAELNINQNDPDVGKQERCEICLSESNVNLIEENNSKYHAPCINFYLNCVEPTPPHSARTAVH